MIKTALGSPAPATFPVGIGGVGGSGTRVVASMLRSLGYHLGHDLNAAGDNLWFTLLFKRPEAITLDDDSLSEAFGLFESAMLGRAFPEARALDLAPLVGRACSQHSEEWYGLRASSLQHALQTGRVDRHPRPWGWKEPNTHFLAARLLSLRPTLRYIHVSRCGKDMAFSANQNQLSLWGPTLMPDWDGMADPSSSLRFWALCQSRVLNMAFAHFPARCHWLDFDTLCDAPQVEVQGLLSFLGIPASNGLVAALAAMVQPPASRGRHAQASEAFSPAATEAYEAYRQLLADIEPARASSP